MKQMAEVKYALEDNVKQNFLEPLTHLQSKDVRDVQVSQRFYYAVSNDILCDVYLISVALFIYTLTDCT